jgi:hypothetical protein
MSLIDLFSKIKNTDRLKFIQNHFCLVNEIITRMVF